MAEIALSPAEQEWDAFVAAHPQGHVLQTRRWAHLKGAFGWSTELAATRRTESPGKPIAGGASLLFRRLPWGQALAYVPKGPIVDWANDDQLRPLIIAVEAACKGRRVAVLKIEPDLPDSPELTARLTQIGFRPSPQRVQPLSTMVIDLDGGPDVILAAMKPKWRYNIRLAERKGVAVRCGAVGDLPAIQALMETTGRRDGFAVHSLDYYRLATELFEPAGLAKWFIAEHEGKMLAAIAVFALGAGSWYMWGASADEGRNLMPNHALQWAAMRWAKERGCRYYDLWGIPDEVGARPEAYAEPESWGEGGLWGVYRFKQGFGGRIVRFTGAWDLPLSSAGYALYRLALKVRRQAAE